MHDPGPIELVVLQGTSFCNLNCTYCYLSKESRRDRSTLPLLSIDPIFTRILSSRFVGKSLHVSWHSGEPLVLDRDYYREAIDRILALRDRLAPGLDIHFDIQTNGTLINAEWCRFFAEYRDLLTIGISCDGPEHLHDTHRRNWAGRPTHAQVVRGMQLLREHAISFDVIAVVSPEGLEYGREFIDFFAGYADTIREFHFNLHDELGEDTEPGWLDAYRFRYAGFLRDLLAACASVPDAPRVRNFSTFYEMALAPATDRFSASAMSWPFKSLTVQANGDVATFYAGLTGSENRDLYGDGRGLLVGNLLTDDLETIAASPKLARIWEDFEASHAVCQSSCAYFGVCGGGYNLVKVNRHGTMDSTDTPECQVHVQTFARVMLEELEHAAARAPQQLEATG